MANSNFEFSYPMLTGCTDHTFTGGSIRNITATTNVYCTLMCSAMVLCKSYVFHKGNSPKKGFCDLKNTGFSCDDPSIGYELGAHIYVKGKKVYLILLCIVILLSYHFMYLKISSQGRVKSLPALIIFETALRSLQVN